MVVAMFPTIEYLSDHSLKKQSTAEFPIVFVTKVDYIRQAQKRRLFNVECVGMDLTKLWAIHGSKLAEMTGNLLHRLLSNITQLYRHTQGSVKSQEFY